MSRAGSSANPPRVRSAGVVTVRAGDAGTPWVLPELGGTSERRERSEALRRVQLLAVPPPPAKQIGPSCIRQGESGVCFGRTGTIPGFRTPATGTAVRETSIAGCGTGERAERRLAG